MMLAGVCSAGFITTVQPAAMAGASFQVAISSGEVPGNNLADDALAARRMLSDSVVAFNSVALPSSARITLAK